ncbi:MAG: hypothetical protein MHM6MM_001809 [Cercozoa sp. M6MM]
MDLSARTCGRVLIPVRLLNSIWFPGNDTETERAMFRHVVSALPSAQVQREPVDVHHELNDVSELEDPSNFDTTTTSHGTSTISVISQTPTTHLSPIAPQVPESDRQSR